MNKKTYMPKYGHAHLMYFIISVQIIQKLKTYNFIIVKIQLLNYLPKQNCKSIKTV